MEFLDNANNIWQAACYLNPASSSNFSKITEIQDGSNFAKDLMTISTVLIRDFFPPLPMRFNEPRPPTEALVQASQLLYEALTKEEVQRVIFNAKPMKAPGPDTLPVLVWQKLWPVV